MLNVTPIPAFTDNYIWLISNTKRKSCIIVDPGDAKPVLDVLQTDNIDLTAILITHHHWDHINGISELLQHYPHTPVYGPANEKIPHKTHSLKEGDIIKFTTIGFEFKVLDVPGHTAGHIAYYGEGRLFCGDTLFACGCGRIFDSTAKNLYYSLVKISQLPAETLIYCTHEYTLDNIGFAQWVEPENKALLQRLDDSKKMRANNRATIPFTLSLEQQTNPFLRVSTLTVIERLKQKIKKDIPKATKRFAILRQWKDLEYD
jgi:hydroxyacylglutathione hydrolase